MMTLRHASLLAFLALPLAISAVAQLPTSAPPVQNPQQPTPQPGSPNAGPTTDQGPLIVKKKTNSDDNAPPPAPDHQRVKNPNGDTYSLRVDVPIVSLDVNVILDKNHQFVSGL